MNKFVISGHARQRMGIRKISMKMIRDTIFKSEYMSTGYFGRLLAFRSFPRGLLKVVYVREGKRILLFQQFG